MEAEAQDSIQQRMREYFAKLRGYGSCLPAQNDFTDYSLCMDRLDRLLNELVSEKMKTQEEKKEISKEIKLKINQLKEVKKEFESVKKESEESKQQLQRTIIFQENTISQLRRKLQNVKRSTQYYQFQHLQEENTRLHRQIARDQAQIQVLQEERHNMVALDKYTALQKQLTECQKHLDTTPHWQRKYHVLSEQTRIHLDELESQRQKIKHLESVISSQKQTISQEEEIIYSMIDDDEKNSINSNQTCQSTNEYRLKDAPAQKPKKKRRPRPKPYIHRGPSSTQIQTIQQEPDETVTQEPTPTPLQQTTKDVSSFSIVMFILAGLLAIPVPGWNC